MSSLGHTFCFIPYCHQHLSPGKEMQSSETGSTTNKLLYMAYETNSSSVFEASCDN